eukprot:m.42356 g.42356  ORF g.42356 m.42356 type:complete len:79 (+) comp11535_c0_seq4:1574-1810(+)
MQTCNAMRGIGSSVRPTCSTPRQTVPLFFLRLPTPCQTSKMLEDLPGHEGSVFAVDWAPNGDMVASGGADKKLKLWRR